MPPFGKEIYFDYATRARYNETCMETLSAFLSIRTLFLFVCISSFISVFISSLITTFCLLMTRFYSLLDKFSNLFLVFKTLMVSLFFRFNLLMVYLLLFSDCTVLLINQTWSWKEGWYGCCGSGSATGSCVRGTAAAVSLTWYWRY